MKRSLSIFIVLIFTVLVNAQSLNLVYNENFSDNTNGWSDNKSTEKYSTRIVGGSYYFEHKRTDGAWTSWNRKFIDTEGDFTIEAKIKKVSGILNNGYGIIFGRKDSDNQYQFEISGNGSYRYDREVDGKVTAVKGWTKSSYINKGNGVYNTLTLKKIDKKVKFYINNGWVYTDNFDRFLGNIFGFIINKNQKIAVDYLKIYSEYESESVVFFDDFKNNDKNWIDDDNNSDRKLDIKDGFYYFAHKSDQDFWTIHRSVTIDDSKDFKIEALIKKVSGIQNNGYGVLFGRKDNDNMFDFRLSGDGHYRINEHKNGDYVKHSSWVKSDAVNKGNGATNQLSIIKKGNKLKFFVNGRDVYTTQYKGFPGDRIGFKINQNQEIAADYLRVTYLKTETYNFAPSITIEAPVLYSNSATTYDNSILIEGSASDSDGINAIYINGNFVKSTNGRFSKSISLNSGSNNITVRAYDNKNKSTAKSFTVTKKAQEYVANNSYNNVKKTSNNTVYKTKEKRVALVVGNTNYKGQAKLGPNPINDANDMAATLQSLGFQVIKKIDANLTTLNNAIREFGRKNKDADVALFFFAGHGMQVDRFNYIVPVDINMRDKNDVDFECVSVKKVQKIMETSNSDRLNIVILDACRNNPFRSWQRGGDDGLAGMSPPSGTLIAFATSPGATASNGKGRNGLYTGELVKQLKKPQRIEDVFINTRISVEEKSGGRQSPWELARLRGKYWLRK